MSYTVNHTNGQVLTTVADQVIDNTSSLSFVGKNYAGYAKLLADNFLHLMENFSNSTAPSNAVEGQLWYDNTSGINLLKVYDGTKWNPAGTIKKATSAPLVGDSINGDLWVNPDTKQLFMFSGSTWDLIGPQFSNGLKTGPIVDVITDILNDTHSVLSVYSHNERIAIFSSDVTFTPKVSISGFDTINRGINLSSTSVDLNVAKLWGNATSADGLTVNNTVISSSSFLRSDVSSVTNNSLNIQSNDGISIGNDLSFKISSNDTPRIISLTSKLGKSISFNFINSSTNESVAGLFISPQLKVGIGNSTPAEALDVSGNASIRNNLSVAGDTSITGNLFVNATATFTSVTQFDDTIGVYKADGGTVLLPVYTPDQTGQPLYDIGSEEFPFNDIYAKAFHGTYTGDVTGTVHGNVTGTAASLANFQSFSLVGDITCDPIEFNGTTNVVFNTTVTPQFISSKTAATSSLDTDQILTFRPSTGVQRITKSLFLSSVPAVPVGAIFPFAGMNVPYGYLLCDGGEILINTYPELFNLVQYSYRNKAALTGAGTFALPDLRGRFPLGRDNMDNNLTVPSVDGTTTLNAGGNRNGIGVASSNPANRVHHSSAITIGAGSGNEAFGAPAVVGAEGSNVTTNLSGQPNSIMNPYQTINYIIFTGVLK
jgi:microcystin-dependent protein